MLGNNSSQQNAHQAYNTLLQLSFSSLNRLLASNDRDRRLIGIFYCGEYHPSSRCLAQLYNTCPSLADKEAMILGLDFDFGRVTSFLLLQKKNQVRIEIRKQTQDLYSAIVVS